MGYFLGDGTGAGKGRQVASVILDRWVRGERRHIWISKNEALLEDARRDWSALGGLPIDVQPLGQWKLGVPIGMREGILFVTYPTLRSGRSDATRLDQILEWAGEDFDGLIVFDEAHAMANAAGGEGSRGKVKGSEQGIAGVRIQNLLPRARVLYASATGASDVNNLAYANRRLADLSDAEREALEIDLSPREYVVDYLTKSFPVRLMAVFTDENGNARSEPMSDENGAPVLCRSALAARDRMGAGHPTEVVLAAVRDGGLESVLDEHFWLALGQMDASQLIDDLGSALHASLGWFTFRGLPTSTKAVRIRCHAAVPFSGTDSVDSEAAQRALNEPDLEAPPRAEGLRRAFNTPFWPHVLATTSIGQEGLDFHSWCRRIVHWDLPANPIDLEQREGRISRYGGLLVRRPLGMEVAPQALVAGGNGRSPWGEAATLGEALFPNQTGLSPWWTFKDADVDQTVGIKGAIRGGDAALVLSPGG